MGRYGEIWGDLPLLGSAAGVLGVRVVGEGRLQEVSRKCDGSVSESVAYVLSGEVACCAAR